MIFHIWVLVSLVDSYDDCVGDDGFLLEPFAVFAFWVFLILESHIVALWNNFVEGQFIGSTPCFVYTVFPGLIDLV